MLCWFCVTAARAACAFAGVVFAPITPALVPTWCRWTARRPVGGWRRWWSRMRSSAALVGHDHTQWRCRNSTEGRTV